MQVWWSTFITTKCKYFSNIRETSLMYIYSSPQATDYQLFRHYHKLRITRLSARLAGGLGAEIAQIKD